MAKTIKSDFSIVTINKPTERSFNLSGNEISIPDISKSNKKKFYISYIQYKDILTTTVELPRDTEESDIPDAIAVKVYDDLALDSSLEYKITYMEASAGGDDNRYFNVFVVNQNLISQLFESIANTTKYIDYIALAPFLISGLYKRNILQADGFDCFIYLQRDDAFLAIYQNGEYFQSRPLRYTLKYICDKYCEYSGNRIDDVNFYNQLKYNGINFDSQTERDFLIQIFDDIFFYVGDIITSINKLYGLNIQNVYFSTDIGEIPGMEMFIEDRLGLIKRNFNFNIALNSKDFEITQLDVMMMLLSQDYLMNKNDEFNYSPYKRPAPLFQRPSGKLIGFGLLGLLMFAWPGAYYGYGKFLSIDTSIKTAEYNEAHREANAIKDSLESLEKEIEATRKLTKEEEALSNENDKLLRKMDEKKNRYPMKAKAIYDLGSMLNSNNANVIGIIGEENNLTMLSKSSTDKNITNLLNTITNFKDEKGKRKYEVTTRKIQRFEEGRSVGYDSNITVEFGR